MGQRLRQLTALLLALWQTTPVTLITYIVGSLVPRPNQPPARIAFSIARGDTESDPHWGWLGLGTRLISWECEQIVCC